MHPTNLSWPPFVEAIALCQKSMKEASKESDLFDLVAMMRN